MSETSKSYQHEDESLELERLITQFRLDWKWEKSALGDLGVLPQKSNRRVLSYGCGVGIDVATLLEQGYASYAEGWDAKRASVKEATRRFGNERLIFRHVDLVSGEPPEAKFDIIYLRLVLLHVPLVSILPLLKQCRDLLNEDGYLVVHDGDKEKGGVIPPNHEFNLILDRILEYLVSCGNSPEIGRLVPGFLFELGFEDVKSKTIVLKTTFEETRDDLIYSKSIRDDSQPDGKLIPQSLWIKASQNKTSNFERTSFRVLTVARR